MLLWSLPLQTIASNHIGILVSLTLLSPAKINLDFKILGRREDGYHLIRSEMVALDLFDRIDISLSDKNYLNSSQNLPFQFSNSIFQKVWEEFNQRFPGIPNFEIILDKKIPIGAGLGGGSSNAATFIYAINKILGLDLTFLEMGAIGAKVGSDVPFFFTNGRALAEGTGTDLTQYDPVPGIPYTLLFDGIQILTPLVYKSVDLYLLDNDAKNQLERFAMRAYPSYEIIWKGWKSVFADLQMSGSGSTAFVRGIHDPASHRFDGCVCRTIARLGDRWYE
ncbi:MAG: hypothetical protein FJZ61_03150 [Chlamydiae bacterium]|nr:hypothetical protein [Chlamydiota bacterium]